MNNKFGHIGDGVFSFRFKLEQNNEVYNTRKLTSTERERYGLGKHTVNRLTNNKKKHNKYSVLDFFY